LAAATFLPIVVEHSTNPANAYGALATALGGIGGNLIANLAQHAYDEARSGGDQYDIANLAAILEKQMQTNDEISEAVALLVQRSGALSVAFDLLQNLPQQWNAFAAKLLDQAKNLSGTSVVIENVSVGHLTIVEAKAFSSLESLIRDYLRVLAADTDELRLGTIDPKFELDSPIKLSQVYVHPGVQRTGVAATGTIVGIEDPLTVISEAFEKDGTAGIVLLGGPGAGKSALVDRLANSLSLGLLALQDPDHGDEGDSVWRREVPSWKGQPVVPVRVSLQEFAARSLPVAAEHGTSGALWEHIRQQLGAYALSDFAAHLNLMLSGRKDTEGKRRDRPRDGGLVLLDGLDEVPHQQRSLVQESIGEFSKRFNASVIVVTCRTRSWAEEGASSRLPGEKDPLAGFRVYEIAPFSQEQISLFAERWYAAVRSLKRMSDDAVQYRIETLKAACKTPSLVPLAERPLLLTLMATLHTSRGQLPHDRATLYADCVDLVLEVWQRAKDLHIGGRTTVEGGLLEEFGLSSATVERTLRGIAYDLHVAARKTSTRARPEPRITGEQLRKAFKPLVGNSWDEADRFVSYLQRRAGILEYEGDETYRFPHRTFQEFLAACHLLDRPDSPASLIRSFVSDYAWWGEVFSLAVARQSCISYSQAVHILDDTFLKMARRKSTDGDAWATLLNAARDINLADRQEDSTLYSNVLHRLIDAFLRHSGLTLRDQVVAERGSVFASSSKVLLPHVLPLLEDDDAGDAGGLYLGLYGDSELTPRLLSLLAHEEPLVRARAAHALGGIGDRQAHALLARLSREDGSPAVRMEALGALGKGGGDAAVSALIHGLSDNDGEVRDVSVEVLGRIGDDRTVHKLCNRIEDVDLDTAKAMIRVLSAMASPEAIEYLVGLLDSPELSSFAEDALVEVGSPAIEPLVDAYQDAEEETIIHHLRYILVTLGHEMLWREKDRDFTDQLSEELHDDDWR
jgi:HEAT repeat protein